MLIHTMFRLAAKCAFALGLVPLALFAADQPFAPPATRIQVVTDTIHGVAISDPYRWLEEGGNPEVRDWTEKQFDYFQSYVDNFPGRDSIRSELTRMLAAGGIGEVFSRGELYFSMKRLAGQNQPVMYVRHGLKGTPEVLIDPNKFSADGTRAMDWYFPSEDGSMMAYGRLSLRHGKLHTISLADQR